MLIVIGRGLKGDHAAASRLGLDVNRDRGSVDRNRGGVKCDCTDVECKSAR